MYNSNIKRVYFLACFASSGRRDSNPLPTAWEAVALPGELLPLKLKINN